WLVKLTPTYPALGLLVPLVLYFVYTRQVLPGLRVFKHTLRGMSYARLGRYRPALTALRRATQLDPNNRLAREALWEVHRDPDAAGTWKLKRLLYHAVTEAEYDATPPANPPPAAGEGREGAFDHSYAQQLGLALVADPQRWRRGAEYLRLAARGLPQNAATI